MLKNLFKRIDIFGKTVNLRYQEQELFKTTCGACATLTLILIMLTYLVFESFTIINGKGMIIDYIKKDFDEDISYKNFTVVEKQVFGFAVPNQKHFGEKAFKFEYGIKKLNGNYESIKNTYDCSDLILSKLSKRVHLPGISNIEIRCFDFPYRELHEGSLPTLTVLECLDKGCIKISDRKKILKEFEIWAFLLTDESDFTDESKTVKRGRYGSRHNRFMGVRVKSSRDFSKVVKLFVRQTEFHETSGLLIEQKRKVITNVYQRSQEQILSLNPKEKILEISIELDRISKALIIKKYKTILDLLAYMGGFSKGIAMVLMVLVIPVREVLYAKKLINHMFNICLTEEQINSAVKVMYHGEDGNDPGENPSFDMRSLVKKKSEFREKGLFAEMMKLNANQKQMMEKMLQFQNDSDGVDKKTLKGLLFSAMGRKEFDRNVIFPEKAEYNFSEDGQMKELSGEEIEVLKTESVTKGLKNWLVKSNMGHRAENVNSLKEPAPTCKIQVFSPNGAPQRLNTDLEVIPEDINNNSGSSSSKSEIHVGDLEEVKEVKEAKEQSSRYSGNLEQSPSDMNLVIPDHSQYKIVMKTPCSTPNNKTMLDNTFKSEFESKNPFQKKRKSSFKPREEGENGLVDEELNRKNDLHASNFLEIED